MSEAQVVVRGRFEPGTVVALVRVPDERAQRPAGGQTIDRKRVDPSGTVKFRKGVELGGRYFVTGLSYGRPTDVRAVGSPPDESPTGYDPVVGDRRKNAAGDWIDPPRGPEDDWLDDESPSRPERRRAPREADAAPKAKAKPKAKTSDKKPAPKRRATPNKTKEK